MIIPDKDTMIRLSIEGAFGNTVRNWSTKEELFSSGHKGNVYIRANSGRPGGVWIKNLPINQVARKVAQLVKSGCEEKHLYFGEWISPKLVVLSGELCRSERIFELRYSRLKMTMRDAFRMEGKLQAKNAHGMKVVEILQSVTDEYSFRQIMDLFDDYPDSVIEFTVYNRSHGTPGQYVIIWEVRNY